MAGELHRLVPMPEELSEVRTLTCGSPCDEPDPVT